MILVHTWTVKEHRQVIGQGLSTKITEMFYVKVVLQGSEFLKPLHKTLIAPTSLIFSEIQKLFPLALRHI